MYAHAHTQIRHEIITVQASLRWQTSLKWNIDGPTKGSTYIYALHVLVELRVQHASRLEEAHFCVCTLAGQFWSSCTADCCALKAYYCITRSKGVIVLTEKVVHSTVDVAHISLCIVFAYCDAILVVYLREKVHRLSTSYS